MNWIIARLREDNTRSAIGQLTILALLIMLALGINVSDLLDQAESNLTRLGALVAVAVPIWLQLQRILQPAPPAAAPLLPDAAVKGLERLGELVGEVRKS